MQMRKILVRYSNYDAPDTKANLIPPFVPDTIEEIIS
ncbi:hypothetical protein H4S14_001386 [Agrobacterium vitis]|nr:hypothetical protein [Agrobacterium vitis]MBE1437648.1 hypothetical protein [Agrobacterium vitis]